jgi:hypothetical protein
VEAITKREGERGREREGERGRERERERGRERERVEVEAITNLTRHNPTKLSY